MKHIKKLVIVGVVLTALLVGALFMWIDRLARVGIETGATYALGVNTTLEGLEIGVFSGHALLTQLRVENPPGFDTPYFMQLGRGSVDVSLGSLMQDKVVVPRLAIFDISVYLENKQGQSNYKVILDGLKKFESTTPEPASTDEAGKRFVIEHITLDNINVQVDLLPIGGKLSRIPLKIERIELHNVGSDSVDGVEIAELTGILLKAILTSVAQKGGHLLPDQITGELTHGLSALQGLGGMTVEVVGDWTTIVDGQVRNVAEAGKVLIESGKQISEGLQEIGKGFGELLKKPKEKSTKP